MGGSMHETYFEYCETYKKKYGDMTLVLIECGSFFELYAINNETEKAGPDDIYRVCDLCNLQLSRKNKSVLENSRSNPLMAGFPSYALSRHAQTLLANQYTLVIVRQVTSPPNPRREITEILSPSINMTPHGVDGNYLMVVYCDDYKDTFQKSHTTLGLTGIDITTGRTWAYEVASKGKDTNVAIDEMVRCFSVYQPREVIVLGDTEQKKLIYDTLGVDNDKARVFHKGTVNKEFYNVAYQNAVISKAYGNDTMLSPIEQVGLEMTQAARIAFCVMLQFVFDHNEAVLKNLTRPEILTTNDKCIIEYNSAQQLQLIGQAHERPLMSLLNRCSTAFGGRYFKEQFLQPLTDTQAIAKRHSDVARFLESGMYHKVCVHLKKVLDLERMARKMSLGTFQPAEWPSFDVSLSAIAQAADAAGENSIHSIIGNIRDGYMNILDIDECGKYNINEIKGNIFKSDNEVSNHLKDLYTDLQNVATKLFPDDNCRIEHNERDNHIFVITKKRWDLAKQTNGNGEWPITLKSGTTVDPHTFVAKPISAVSTGVKLMSPWIAQTSERIKILEVKLNDTMSREYRSFLQTFAGGFLRYISYLVDKVSYLDFVATNAKNAAEYRYIKPDIDSNTMAFMNAKGLRHPIIERIRQDTEYVTNDIFLNKDGLLLFGVNASGKSSLMKAIGLNIIMAQAGMFVAAESFSLGVYKHIFTRISGNDNIYRGWSTFMVEMMELRNILHRCDNHSLVLGDELCSGTESLSALALVAAGIHTLCNKQTAFVFATHLHDLSKLDLPAAVNIAHMHVEVSPDGYIIFDRKLRQGIGSSMYGLEVCHGLGMPDEFLKAAHDIRRTIQGQSTDIVNPKKSRYNSKVFKDVCKVCGATASEVHHLIEQHKADADGFIGHQHKNRESNLIALCEKCHTSVHNTDDTIVYLQTTKGKKVATKKKSMHGTVN